MSMPPKVIDKFSATRIKISTLNFEEMEESNL